MIRYFSVMPSMPLSRLDTNVLGEGVLPVDVDGLMVERLVKFSDN